MMHSNSYDLHDSNTYTAVSIREGLEYARMHYCHDLLQTTGAGHALAKPQNYKHVCRSSCRLPKVLHTSF